MTQLCLQPPSHLGHCPAPPYVAVIVLIPCPFHPCLVRRGIEDQISIPESILVPLGDVSTPTVPSPAPRTPLPSPGFPHLCLSHFWGSHHPRNNRYLGSSSICLPQTTAPRAAGDILVTAPSSSDLWTLGESVTPGASHVPRAAPQHPTGVPSPGAAVTPSRGACVPGHSSQLLAQPILPYLFQLQPHLNVTRLLHHPLRL